MPRPEWDDELASTLSGIELLVYRSRLLAADRSVVNIYGGNTSSKTTEQDHLGRPTRVLWVKGSGSDLADCTERSFACLKLEEVLPLREREAMTDEEMVAHLARCAFDVGRPRQSIETLLHAFCPFAEVDHTHPDAILALACSVRGEEAAREVFGEEMVWIDYIRPGFELSKRVALALEERPTARCVILAKHGLVTWGDTAKACYENTLACIERAEDALREANRRLWAGAGESLSLDPYEWLPVLRGALGKSRRVVLKCITEERARMMVDTPAAKDLAARGAACPDHLVHTRRTPLWLDVRTEADWQGEILEAVAAFEREYRAYFERFADEGVEMFDPIPRVVLVPGFGFVTAGRDEKQADVSAQLYHRAIEVMEGAEAMGGFTSLTEEESFAIEYWPLELYKLQQRPAPGEFEGAIAVVFGGGSGIGRATCGRLHRAGAHVLVADRNEDAARQVAESLAERAHAIVCDVTEESQVEQAFREAVSRWGGVDVVVCSAGIASSAPIEETTLEEWNRNMDVLARGCFLPAREAFRVWRRQGTGGSLVFVTSKNALAAGKNASAYSAAKAAAQHLARCLAEEGGPIGVRVNCVLPDAVIEGSSIWSSSWREERAKAYEIRPEELEEFYRKRNTLQVSIFPADVAEAIAFLCSDRSAKTTGCLLTVDGGVASAYPR
ncbi:MAG: putative oxidoreductase YuxG [Fimbriimonadales bacterium]|nr:MAG: putative oxidoreductase YuxG [Fimbriimonadales bacterium]